MNVIFINLYPQTIIGLLQRFNGYFQMKKIFRLLVILLVISSIAGITTSCAIFNESSHAQTLKPFKHKKALPKKYIIDNGYKPIAK
jgi:hypothetical protein